jgi:hypothetical protein
MLIQ